MAKLDEKKIQETLLNILPPEWIKEKARETGAMKRERKVDIALFIWTLVLSFSTSGGFRTIASIRRAYEQASGTEIEESSFYDRFTAGLVSLTHECLNRMLVKASEVEHKMKGMLERFRDLIITDSTVVRLHAMLRKRFPGVRTNHSPASIKMHAILSVASNGPSSIKVTAGKKADVKVFKVGDWIKGMLLLFDLGYYSFKLFALINKLGGYFVSRLKDNANPVIISSNLKQRGRKTETEGQHLQDVLEKLKREVVDFQVRVSFKTRAYKGVQHVVEEVFRLVGVIDPETGKYHLYLTNVPPDKLTANEVAQVYRYRWEIELLFKELKSYYHLEDLNTRNDNVVLSLIYSAVITCIVARTLQAAIGKSLPKSQRHRIPARRFAAVFATIATELLKLVTKALGITISSIQCSINSLLEEIIDPNIGRKSTMKGLQC